MSTNSEITGEFTKRPKLLIVICGNDGSGKSTLVNALNKRYRDGKTECMAIERSNANGADRVAQFLDKLSLVPAFAQKPDVELPREYAGTPLYYVVLDVPMSETLRRLKARPRRNEWESDLALHYFAFRFRQLAAYFGLPLVSNGARDPDVDVSIHMALHAILGAVQHYDVYRRLALKSLTYDDVVQQLDVETHVARMLRDEQCVLPPDFPTEWFGAVFSAAELRRFAARRYVQQNRPRFDSADGSIRVGEFRMPGALHVYLAVEGESKRVYRIVDPVGAFGPLCLIKLKSTIYSHKRQSTGEIAELAGVRGAGSQIVLELLARCALSHAYLDVSSSGLILAEFVERIPPTEIVVKRFCVGTDRHALHGLDRNGELVNTETGEYRCGPYVRFDWRNPNHVEPVSRRNPADSPYYYLVEETLGKERFFQQYMTPQDASGSKPLFTPVGDTAATSAMLAPVQNIEQTRQTAMRVFLSLQHYLSRCTPALELQDICMMTDRSGTLVWSEINPDCMRVKAPSDCSQYDKDIWRAGGSSARDEVLLKWRKFNEILGAVLRASPFSDNEMHEPDVRCYHRPAAALYEQNRRTANHEQSQLFLQLSKPRTARGQRRRVILTIDLFRGQPSLVQRGVVTETHSNGDALQALERIGVFPDILVVDLDGAFGCGDGGAAKSPNRDIIKSIARERYIYAGGGVRTLDDVQQLLASSVRRVVIGTAAIESVDLIKRIPRDRLIVELSVDDGWRVMTHGRATTTSGHVIDEINRLAPLGVEAISITFHSSEGMLGGVPRDRVERVVRATPRSVRKIIIAGGVSSLDDCEFLWALDERVVPQLGSAIWRQRIEPGELMERMVDYDASGLAPAAVQDKNGCVRGIVWMDREAVRLSADTKQLWRYSRTHGALMLKGASESGNYQRVLQIATNCNGDALLVTVDGSVPFCHENDAISCFPTQTIVKAGVGALVENLRQRGCSAASASSYTAHMQQNPGLAFAKMREELGEIACAQTPRELTSEMADLFVHLLMFANGRGVSFDNVLNELNARRFDPHLASLVVSTSAQRTAPATTVVLGIMADKYTRTVDAYLAAAVGVVVHRNAGEKRDLRVRGEIVDTAMFQSLFGADKRAVALVPMKPKDMPFELSRGRVDAVVSDSVTMRNHLDVAQRPLAEWRDETLRLCLIRRADDEHVLDLHEWSPTNKCLIASEHPKLVAEHLASLGASADTFTLDALSGGAEGYLLNEGTRHYTMCDAIVQSGETLRANGLGVASVITADIKLGVYLRIEKK